MNCFDIVTDALTPEAERYYSAGADRPEIASRIEYLHQHLPMRQFATTGQQIGFVHHYKHSILKPLGLFCGLILFYAFGPSYITPRLRVQLQRSKDPRCRNISDPSLPAILFFR